MNDLMHRPRKRFGQNFLHDPAVIARIVRAVNPQSDDRLVEIGPGLGALTRPLLSTIGRLDVVEIDRDIIPRLRDNCAGQGELHIHNLDVLQCDFVSLAAGHKLRVVGNLPYNIATPFIFHLLDQLPVIRDMHFMVQKEVAQRLAATANTEHYGRLGIMVQLHCTVDLLFGVGPGAFTPAPKVDSAVVRLTPHREMPVKINDRLRFSLLVSKTLRNAIKGLLTADEITSLGIDPARRPETLTLGDFATLSNFPSKKES